MGVSAGKGGPWEEGIAGRIIQLWLLTLTISQVGKQESGDLLVNWLHSGQSNQLYNFSFRFFFYCIMY